MPRSTLAALTFAIALAISGAAFAQGGFFDKLKQNIPSIPGQKSGGGSAALGLGDITAGLKEALRGVTGSSVAPRPMMW